MLTASHTLDRQLVDQNVVMVLTAVFAPPEAVLLQRVDYRGVFALRLPQLRNYITGFLNVRALHPTLTGRRRCVVIDRSWWGGEQAKWRRAQHYWKQDKRDSKKIVATVIRYLLLALELAREGAITDATLGNDYYREVLCF